MPENKQTTLTITVSTDALDWMKIHLHNFIASKPADSEPWAEEFVKAITVK